MKRRPASTDQHVGAGAELAELRATCRPQAHLIDKLDEAMSALRRRVAALTATGPDLHEPGGGPPDATTTGTRPGAERRRPSAGEER